MESMEKNLPDTCEFVFHAKGMHLRYLPEQAENCIPYRNIEHEFATEDLNLLVYDDQIVVLQNKDLISKLWSVRTLSPQKKFWTDLKYDA